MNLAPFQFASVLYFRFWANRQAANMAAIFPHPYHDVSAFLVNPLIIYWSAGSGRPAAKAVYGRNVGGEGRSEGLYRSPGYAWKYVSYGFYTVNRKSLRLI